jgi:uncharacterized protein YegL
MPDLNPEFVMNPAKRCPLVLLLDISGSMQGAPIQELNDGMVAFKQDLETDEIAMASVELLVITFGGLVQVMQDFTTIANFYPIPFTPQGNTPMGEAIELGLSKLEERKTSYKTNGIPYYRPWVWLLTDGAPTDGDKWRMAAQHVQEGVKSNKFLFFAVGVQNANMQKLQEIAPPTTPPVMLKGLSFKAMFQWLSTSLKRVSAPHGSDQIGLPAINAWSVAGTKAGD